MATFELTEFSELPIKSGSGVAVPPAPWIRHSAVTIGPGNEFQLHADTRYVIMHRASADFRYKFGVDQAGVSGANAPTGASSRQLKTTDDAVDYQFDRGGRWIGTV